MNRKISFLSFTTLLLSVAFLSFSSSKAIAQNRMQNATAEARALSAAQCRGSSSCGDCAKQSVVPAIMRKYRIESRREISEVTAAALAGCS